MIVITTENGARYGFQFQTDVDAMLITENGAVIFEPHADVLATLEFPTPAINVEQERICPDCQGLGEHSKVYAGGDSEYSCSCGHSWTEG